MLASLDFLGVRHFVYGGDAEWVRRRWLMAISLSIGWLSTVVACVSAASGRMQVDLAKTIVDAFSLFVMTVIPGYLGFAAWDKKNKLAAGATVSETTTTTVDPGPPATTTETVETAVTPAAAAKLAR